MTLKVVLKSDAIAGMFADNTTIIATSKSLPVHFDVVNTELTNVDKYKLTYWP